MKPFTRATIIATVGFATVSAMTSNAPAQQAELYKNPQLPIETRVKDLVGRMTLEEKVDLLSGKAGDCTKDIPRLGIPSLRVSDGPHGLGWGVKATCFPTDLSMAATWNPDLIRQVGVALGQEARASNRQVLLGPCMNIHRTPLGGRNFESFGEDPYLAGRMAVAYVKGVQSQKVGTSIKHYACNNQEWERTTISVELDERALREIYLPAFKAAVQEADPWTLMGAYNKVRGRWCCENKYLLTDILKNEWGFKGFVVSDWGGTHSTVDAANAGLDLEMPGPGEHLNRSLIDAVKKGEVKQAVIDDKVRRILRVIFLAGLFDAPDPKLKGALATPEHITLARKVAEESIALLKNEGNALPLNRDQIKTLAVIGPNAEVARVGGGGSSTVEPPYAVSPLEGIRKKCGSQVAVSHSKGCTSPMELKPIVSSMLSPPGATNAEHGLRAEYFDNMNLNGEPKVTRIDPEIDFNWGDKSPDPRIPADQFSVRWTGTFTPAMSGAYELGLTSDDGFRLYLDGSLLVDSWVDQAGLTKTAPVTLEAGKAYDLRVEYYENWGGALARFGYIPSGDEMVGDAVTAAAACDAAVVFVGLSHQFEGEGNDRHNLELPGKQNELIESVVKANKNTIVVVISGTPVNMSRWLDQVPAVVEMWYAGLEGGNAIANVLFGDVNPSGKLPMTFPKDLKDFPSQENYPGANGVVRYAEGIYVGYRYFDTKQVEPLFPFGHGLSYTQFGYSDLKIAYRMDPQGPRLGASLNLENTGTREGSEVVQLYVHDVKSSLDRPLKELKAFKKVSLKPGEKKPVTFELGRSALAFYDPARKGWVVEPGAFEILVGSSSRDIRLKGTVDVR
ncbi:MAG: glycoside hydrolase family 3 C-terminal domain-containing protein [Verrucomicrobiota bacterium]